VFLVGAGVSRWAVSCLKRCSIVKKLRLVSSLGSIGFDYEFGQLLFAFELIFKLVSISRLDSILSFVTNIRRLARQKNIGPSIKNY